MAAKTFIVTLSLAAGALCAVTGTFNTYFGDDCNIHAGSGTVYEGYCNNIEFFPYTGFDGSVTSGECEDVSKTPTLSLYLDPGCETDLFTTFAIGSEAQCLAEEASVQSVRLTCA